MTNFVLIGAAGYIAPKHMKAIKDCGGNLIACLDPCDSVGILDSYFPDCKYFFEFERFDNYCSTEKIDYVSICSPNYLHQAHCQFGLRIGASVICEKPLVLNTSNLDRLREVEKDSKGKIWNILQLRLGLLSIKLKNDIIPNMETDTIFVIYHTPRGDWYDYSWKTDIEKSGGIATNIGVHIFDLLLWLLGDEWEIIHWDSSKRHGKGIFIIGGKTIHVDLSIEKDREPVREITIDNLHYDLSGNFGDLHTLSYKEILDNSNGFGIEDAYPAIKLCSAIREL